MQDIDISSRAKPEVLRRQVVPVPTAEDPTLPQLGRRRAVRWLFLRCTSLTAAATRLQGWRGDDHRTTAMRACYRAYFQINGAGHGETTRSEGPYTGVAMLSPEGVVVVAYYGPGDERNTPIAAADYHRVMLHLTKERLVPLSKDSELDKGKGLLPLAARTDRPRFE
ncbi:hypothetical protein [uncultured Zoogloea sp.]|uniref:hypothetical protein n=1 Tax=uncultured Zoogloea sp. TaxID=160237 RepID=UPI002619E21A|nr:hypothetical protein [uncultured Zoogloea sp.]